MISLPFASGVEIKKTRSSLHCPVRELMLMVSCFSFFNERRHMELSEHSGVTPEKLVFSDNARVSVDVSNVAVALYRLSV